MTISEVVWWLSGIVVFNNSLFDYTMFLLWLFGLILIFHVIQLYVVRQLERLVVRTKTEVDNVLVRVVKTVRPPFYLFLAFYWSLRMLQVDAFVNRIADVVLVVWVALQTVLALQVAIDSIFANRLQQEKYRGHNSILEVLRSVVRFVLWLVGILFVLSNVGVNITSLIAGLGIGGIAVALASQNILSDLFNSLVIYFDQPFTAGDFIVIGNDKGTVLKIGVKTTRIRSLAGEEIIIPNRDVAASRIKNFKRLAERRVDFEVVVEDTIAYTRLAQIPALLHDVIEPIENVRFNRAHFHRVEEGSRIFSIVYVVTKSDFTSYMDAHQAILLAITDCFAREKITLLSTRIE